MFEEITSNFSNNQKLTEVTKLMYLLKMVQTEKKELFENFFH